MGNILHRTTGGVHGSALRRRAAAVGAAAVVVLAATSCSEPAAAEPEVQPRDGATVVRVIDGDTLVVDLAGEDVTVRLLNVDTPETKDPNEPVQCLGPEATVFLEEALPPGSSVELEYDVEREDRYGRTLAGVYDDEDRLMNAEVARHGFGIPVTYEPNAKFRPPVDEAYEEARDQQAGLFSTAIECTLPGMVTTAEQAAAAAAAEGTGSAADEAAAAAAVVYALVKTVDETVDALEKAAKTGNNAMWKTLSEAEKTSLKDRADAARTRITTRHEQLTTLRDQRQNAEDEAARVAAEAEAEAQRVAAEAAAAEANRVAAEQAEANRQAAAAEAARAAAAQAEADRQAQQYIPPAYEPPVQSNPYPGYNGPRCYAPGGKSWRPC
ncbi:thermonuclease family protein [Arthrobacter yangruifuii]|uniref:thermonuclease family protein n=1 Tax=Arthrobacter yangruifuii TaxID=2606616 RepID=UPI001AEF2B55|nr:thermonuclease family protein [Arthrobacter yangruifuii]